MQIFIASVQIDKHFDQRIVTRVFKNCFRFFALYCQWYLGKRVQFAILCLR